MKWSALMGFIFLNTVSPVFPAVSGTETVTGAANKPIVVYEARGTWVSFDAQAKQATISHEKIPGYMDAMTMSFDLRDVSNPGGFRRGDEVIFHLCVQGDDAWVDHLKKTTGDADSLLVPAARPPHELKVGEPLPDIELVSQSGTKIRLSDFHGQVLAITFIYTSCPLPTYCLRINQNFRTTLGLMERLAPEKGWHFLSISFDAQRDRPEVLAAYAGTYQADPQTWTFAAATESAAHAIGDGVGLEFKQTESRIDHNLRTVVLDAAGRIRFVFRGNHWTAQELAAQMYDALR